MQRFNALLQQAELSAITKHAQEKQAAQKIWEAIAPEHLAQISHASSLKNQQLHLLAHSNVVAAKIKLLSPSLLIQLEKLGYEVTAIRVKVQVKSTPQSVVKPPKKLSATAISQLTQLEQKLKGSTLGNVLNRLIKNAD